MGGWIYQDPTFNCFWKVDGKPASAMLLHDALMERRPIEFSPDDKQTELRLSNYYLDVGFDLPSGGAFRVIDVIVTEAPRFSADER
jgi:hypothetical protein